MEALFGRTRLRFLENETRYATIICKLTKLILRTKLTSMDNVDVGWPVSSPCFDPDVLSVLLGVILNCLKRL